MPDRRAATRRPAWHDGAHAGACAPRPASPVVHTACAQACAVRGSGGRRHAGRCSGTASRVRGAPPAAGARSGRTARTPAGAPGRTRPRHRGITPLAAESRHRGITADPCRTGNVPRARGRAAQRGAYSRFHDGWRRRCPDTKSGAWLLGGL